MADKKIADATKERKETLEKQNKVVEEFNEPDKTFMKVQEDTSDDLKNEISEKDAYIKALEEDNQLLKKQIDEKTSEKDPSPDKGTMEKLVAFLEGKKKTERYQSRPYNGKGYLDGKNEKGE